MEEAYTVGVRLALEDGVSAGIAAVGAEMAALERVTAAGMAGLERFRALGAVVGRPAAEAARAVDALSAPDRESPSSEHGPTFLPTRAAAQALPERDAVVHEPAAQVIAPASPVSSAEVDAPATPRAQAAPLVVRLMPSAVRARDNAPAAPSVAAHDPAPDNARDAAPMRAAWATLERPAASRAESAAPVTTLPSLAPVPAGQMPSAAPQGSVERDQGPTGGDVYLDGARMGRWIADHMARAASRPQGGGTAFDGRMGPAYPGTLQGG